MRRVLVRNVMLLGGTTLAFLNVLPSPWWLRLGWAKFLYWLTVKGTFIFPSIFEFVQAQNLNYGIGKQRGQSLSSILQLQKVLEHLESREIPLEEIRRILGSAGTAGESVEGLARFLAKSAFGNEEGATVLRTTSDDRQTW